MRAVMVRVFMGALIGCSLAGCDWMKPKMPGAAERSAKEKLADARRLKRACGSAETYDRLKAFAFDEAAKIRRGDSPLLDRIAANATVRMENPVAKSRDEQLDVTVCEGHLVLDLPPGTEDAFDGDRRLEADVEYAAQQAVDGSGLVYQMQGAEPIIYRLAALTLGEARRPVPNGETQVVSAPTPAPRAAPVAVTPPPPPPVRVAANPRPAPPPAAPAPRPAPPVPQVAQDRPAASARPSFNCRSARSRVERMICSDADLTAQDRRMSSAFYAALAQGGPARAELRASRDRFLGYRDRCPTAACVSQAYEDRISEISDIADR